MDTERSVAGAARAGLADRRAAEPMVLAGTLRRRGADFSLAQPPDDNAGPRSGWATPRIYRVLATDATEGDLGALVDRDVTITGRPGYVVARHRSFLMVDSVVPTVAAGGRGSDGVPPSCG